jgi:Ca-activated chloride channel homolog
MGNFNDVLLEQLADKGNGSYGYIDSVEEARRVFVQNLTGTLQTIARDAKIQVDFNPEVVSRYRLIGYENRDVADKDFRNDRVDGGEVGAGQSVTALYEVTRKPGSTGNPATLTIRYQSVDRKQPLEQSQSIGNETFRSTTVASERLRLAATVAQFAEVLKHSFWAREMSLNDVRNAAVTRIGDSSDPQVRDLLALIERAAGLRNADR